MSDSEIIEYSKKVMEYYQKVKKCIHMIDGCKDIRHSVKLFDIYFELLKKMNHYNTLIYQKVEGPANLKLKHEIRGWKKDAVLRCNKMKKWINEYDVYNNEKRKVMNNINELHGRHETITNETNEFIDNVVENENRMLVDLINDVLEGAQFKFESINEPGLALVVCDIRNNINKSDLLNTRERDGFDYIIDEISEHVTYSTIKKIKELICNRSEKIDHCMSNNTKLVDIAEKVEECKQEIKEIDEDIRKHNDKIKTII